jgi:hypothetical protein
MVNISMRIYSIFIFTLLTYTGTFGQTDYTLFYSEGKTGIKDKSGQIIIPAQYERLGWSDGSFSIISGTTGYQLNDKWGLLQVGHRQITGPEYTKLWPAGTEMLLATKKTAVSEKTGIIDINGKTIINFEYESLKTEANYMTALLKVNNKYRYGILNLSGHFIIRPDWVYIKRISASIWLTGNESGENFLFNYTGAKIITHDIDSIGDFKDTYAIIYAGAGRGLINQDGKLIAEPIYKEITFNESGLPLGQRFDEWKLFTRENKTLKLIEADSIETFTGRKLRLFRNHLINLVDENKPESIEITAQNISNPIQGYASIKTENKFGLLDSTGKIIIQPKYDTIKNYGEIWLFKSNPSGTSSWFLVNTKKPVSIKGTWSEIIPAGNFFKMRKQGYAGIIDKNGFEKIPPVYDSIYEITENHITVRMLGKYGIINHQEKWIIYPQDDPLELINDSLYLQRSKTISYLRGIPANLIYFTSNKINLNQDHLEETMPDGRIKKVSLSGVEIRDSEYQMDNAPLPGTTKINPTKTTFPITENLQGFFEDGKYGFKDERGRLRIANRYDSIVPFSESRAAVKLLGKWGFIDQYDKLIIQPQFDKPAFFKNQFALVLKNGKYGIIDHDGQTRLNFEFEFVQPVPEEPYLIIRKEHHFGLCHYDGRLLLEPAFEKLYYIGKNEVLVKRNNYGVITTNGLPLIPLIYDELRYLSSNNLFLSKRKPLPENLIR